MEEALKHIDTARQLIEPNYNLYKPYYTHYLLIFSKILIDCGNLELALANLDEGIDVLNKSEKYFGYKA